MNSLAHMRAYAAGRAGGVRAFVVLFLLAPAFFSLGGEEPRPAPQESLTPMQFYDAARDDYRTYKPEDIPVQQGGCHSQPGSAPGLPGGFLNLLMYAALAILLGFIIYLVVRYIQERRLLAQQLLEEEASLVHHSAVPENLAREAGLNEPLSLKRLRELIQESLAAADYRRAAIFIFLFLLLKASALGWFAMHKDFTAREYLRAFETSDPAPRETLGPAFRDAVRLFELALYGDRPPPAQETLELWRRLSEALP